MPYSPSEDRFGFLERLFGIAGDLLAGRFGARAGLAEVLFVDQVRHHFVLDLDLADGFARDFFGGGGHGGHFRARAHWISVPASAMTWTAFTPFIFSAALVSMEVTFA